MSRPPEASTLSQRSRADRRCLVKGPGGAVRSLEGLGSQPKMKLLLSLPSVGQEVYARTRGLGRVPRAGSRLRGPVGIVRRSAPSLGFQRRLTSEGVRLRRGVDGPKSPRRRGRAVLGQEPRWCAGRGVGASPAWPRSQTFVGPCRPKEGTGLAGSQSRLEGAPLVSRGRVRGLKKGAAEPESPPLRPWGASGYRGSSSRRRRR